MIVTYFRKFNTTIRIFPLPIRYLIKKRLSFYLSRHLLISFAQLPYLATYRTPPLHFKNFFCIPYCVGQAWVDEPLGYLNLDQIYFFPIYFISF